MNTININQLPIDEGNQNTDNQYTLKIITESSADFKVTIQLDYINKRLKILKYKAKNYNRLSKYLVQAALQHRLDKIIIVAHENDWARFIKRGFQLEAFNPYYYQGQPGYYLVRFLSKSRKDSSEQSKKNEIVKLVSSKVNYKNIQLQKPLSLRPATENDIPGLANLYENVFASYPTPISEKDYLQDAMENDTFFMVITDGNEKIVSAASAEIDRDNLCAEVTDCATLPEYRGNKLMYHLIKDIQKEMKKIGLISLYTIARAISPSINTSFSRNGYRYFGRFIKNCHICDDFEDMNLWVKKI